jgi:uncharacterized membrane protein
MTFTQNIIRFVKNKTAESLVFLTALSYFSAYLREIGYCTYFDLPILLIKIDTINILEAAATIGVASGMAGATYYSYSSFSKYYYVINTFRATIVKVASAILVILLMASIIMIELIDVWFFITILITPILIIGITLWLSKKEFNAEVDELKKRNTYSTWDQLYDDMAKTRFKKKTSSSWSKYDQSILMVMGLPLLLGYFFAFGYGSAYAKNQFPSFVSSNNTLIITQYGDTFICKAYDMKKNGWSNFFSTVKISDKDLLFVMIDIK